MTQPAQPCDAATVLLLRPSTPFEIFMVKRHSKSRFMGGMYVYPGGKRDENDGTPEMETWCDGLDAGRAAAILGSSMEPYRALGHFVAAVRETFEEAGVLLATTATGERLDPLAPGMAAIREALRKRECSMLDLVTELRLRLDLGRLRYYAHWITPPVEPRRFSARFFLCRVPEDQIAAHDEYETTDGIWLTPAQALKDYADCKFMTGPPTLRVLEQMALHSSIKEALAAAPHAPVEPNAPRFVFDGKTACLVMPGDPVHPDQPGDRRFRFELRDERWVTVIDTAVL